MAHFRKQIRTEIRTRLEALPSIDPVVVDSREIPISEGLLPVAFLVFDLEDLSNRRSTADGNGEAAQRTLKVVAGAICKNADELDELADELEWRLAPSLMPGVQHTLQAVAFQDPKRGEREFFSISLHFDVDYLIDQRFPDQLAE